MAGTIIPTRRLTYTQGRKGFIIETTTRITKSNTFFRSSIVNMDIVPIG
jgi:hypothetical protein